MPQGHLPAEQHGAGMSADVTVACGARLLVVLRAEGPMTLPPQPRGWAAGVPDAGDIEHIDLC